MAKPDTAYPWDSEELRELAEFLSSGFIDEEGESQKLTESGEESEQGSN